mmetsp:Transcript_16953/g.27194  ORF Transcript_16953/g.27194 Transcript_16953/m.27194 type:complete len:277 (-) Transcript_16953:205-1035(-)
MRTSNPPPSLTLIRPSKNAISKSSAISSPASGLPIAAASSRPISLMASRTATAISRISPRDAPDSSGAVLRTNQRKAPTATPASTRRMMRQRRRRRALALNSSPHRANRPMSCFSKSRRVRTCISIRGKRPSPLVLPKPALRPFMLIICPSCDASRASSSASASATSFFCSAMAPSAFPLSASSRMAFPTRSMILLASFRRLKLASAASRVSGGCLSGCALKAALRYATLTARSHPFWSIGISSSLSSCSLVDSASRSHTAPPLVLSRTSASSRIS